MGVVKNAHNVPSLCEKERDIGLRFNSDLPSLMNTMTNIPAGNNRPFKLLSLPLYMIGQAKRLIGSCLCELS